MICVLSGGGVDCVALLGALKYLDKKPTHYIACSCGALISAFLIANYPVDDILQLFLQTESIDTDAIDVNQCMKGYGMYNVDMCLSHVEANFNKRFGINITLSQFFDATNINLTIVGSNLSTKQPEYFNHRTHGNMSLFTCLRITCCIPLLFQTIKHSGSHYVDGGLYDIFPYKYAKQQFKTTPVVAVCIKSSKAPTPIESIGSFLYNFSMSVIETIINNTSFDEESDVYSIDTSYTGMDVLSYLSLPTSKKLSFLKSLIQEGYIQCEKIHLKDMLSKE